MSGVAFHKDMSLPAVRTLVQQHIRARRPKVLVVSPPCTMFSCAQNMNRGKVSSEVWRVRLNEGQEFVDFAMDLCSMQLRGKRGFVFEHPRTAVSWNLASVRTIAQAAESTDSDLTIFDEAKIN